MEKLLSSSLYLLFNSYDAYPFASPLKSIFTIISQHAFDKENSVKNSDKNLSGKSDEREVKICKNRFFALHSSFFILRKLRFLTLIPYLWRGQR